MAFLYSSTINIINTIKLYLLLTVGIYLKIHRLHLEMILLLTDPESIFQYSVFLWINPLRCVYINTKERPFTLI